jgi:hypothetical protein
MGKLLPFVDTRHLDPGKGSGVPEGLGGSATRFVIADIIC